MNVRKDENTKNTQSNSMSGSHAVVIGGSLAGLLSAGVLSNHFDRVTLIERDAFPTSPEPRRGTPQANHVHALMPRGRFIIELLFPGLHAQMMAAGAPLVDMAKDIAWLTPQGWGVRFKSDLEVLAFTRPLLDFHVRRRLASNPRIRIMDNTELEALIPANNNSVGGVVVRRRVGNGDSVQGKIIAELVVDASGRASRAPQWLKEIGCPAPEDLTVNAHLGYASRLFEIPAGFKADWKCVFVQAAPPERKRGGILFTVEGNRWLVTMIGGGRDYPPHDESGFFEFARSLATPIIYDAIRNATPLSSIKVHRGTENRLRQFHNVANQPRNFIAVGDSVCAFNPVYGQGMTIAAMGAMTLDDCLRKWGIHDPEFSSDFQKRLTKVIAAPWMLATSEDFRYRETEGGSANRRTKFMHRYMDEVLKLSTFDSGVRRVLLQALGMLVPPSALFRPKVSLRVVQSKLARTLRARKQIHAPASSRIAYDTAD